MRELSRMAWALVMLRVFRLGMLLVDLSLRASPLLKREVKQVVLRHEMGLET